MHPDQAAKFKMLNDLHMVTNLDAPIISQTSTEDVKPTCETLENLVKMVTGWHHDRNLIKGSTDKDQTLKLVQELGELSDSVCKNKDVRDDIGDMLVVLINIAERNKFSLEDCLQKAWDDIKDRKGTMIDGVFVKEQDLMK